MMISTSRTMVPYGFTLLELLIVIAIIGVLSAVVLGSLSTARDKGSDAAIMATLNNFRAQAELYYDDQNPNSYTGLCATLSPIASVTTINAGGSFTCGNSLSAYAMYSTLVTNPLNRYCIDSRGFAGIITTPVSATRCR